MMSSSPIFHRSSGGLMSNGKRTFRTPRYESNEREAKFWLSSANAKDGDRPPSSSILARRTSA